MPIFCRGSIGLFSREKARATLLRFSYTPNNGWISSEVGCDSFSEPSLSKWKRVNSHHFGIKGSSIPSPTWTVLKILRCKGYDAYLVGGCVRDLILNKVPKDFDVITTAKLVQIKKHFHRARIVGSQFPICMVHIKGLAIEVSSFDTVAKNDTNKEDIDFSNIPAGFDLKDVIRCRNSMRRDFTINSLFFDPVLNQIYDYTNGIADLKSLKLRTLVPAQLSFQEDSARILRGLRIAGRLGLTIPLVTQDAMREFSSSLMSLNKSRLMLEMNYMMCYGAAQSSFRLLHQFRLLEIFLPFHAAYLDDHAKDQSLDASMMMKLLGNLDKLVSCDRPCCGSLWIALLAFHQALIANPQDGFVVLAMASILYHGQWIEGIKFARKIANNNNNHHHHHHHHHHLYARFIPETVDFCGIIKSDKKLAKKVAHLASLVEDSVAALIDEKALLKVMSKYPNFNFSGLVFVPPKMGNTVVGFFHVLAEDIESFNKGERQNSTINYSLLAKGNAEEIRFVLGKVILETMRSEPIEKIDALKETSMDTRRRDLEADLKKMKKKKKNKIGEINEGKSTVKIEVLEETPAIKADKNAEEELTIKIGETKKKMQKSIKKRPVETEERTGGDFMTKTRGMHQKKKLKTTLNIVTKKKMQHHPKKCEQEKLKKHGEKDGPLQPKKLKTKNTGGCSSNITLSSIFK